MRAGPLSARPERIESLGHVRVRQIELAPAIEADLVRSLFDREHAAEVTVATAKKPITN